MLLAWLVLTVSKPRKVNHPRYRWIVTYKDGSKRKKKYFVRKVDAEAYYDEKQQESLDHGTKEEAFTRSERQAVLAFRDLVKELSESVEKPTLSDAVALFRETQRIRHKSKIVQDIVDDYLLKLERKKVSQSYLYSTQKRLERFTGDYGDWLACDISQEIVGDWLEDLMLGDTTLNHYRTVLVQLFNHALDMGAVEINPVIKIAKKKSGPTEIGILTLREVSALLNAASDEILPGLALGFFAGVRREELCRMDWSEIDFKQKLVEVTAAKAKTASRRLIPMRPNLRTWILPHKKKSGPVMPSEMIYRSRLDEAKQAANIETWPHNALRHSFASYHLAAFQDAPALALEMGHTDTRMIFEHYRALVTPKEGKRYWKVVRKSA